jgi:hypothetical protein
MFRHYFKHLGVPSDLKSQLHALESAAKGSSQKWTFERIGRSEVKTPDPVPVSLKTPITPLSASRVVAVEWSESFGTERELLI